ncbi:MAG: hypothetical protein M1819_004890 [Sarea resinae]|nr:MAG: hypothetical protein M1819_004890 [Sarea resinae]
MPSKLMDHDATSVQEPWTAVNDVKRSGVTEIRDFQRPYLDTDFSDTAGFGDPSMTPLTGTSLTLDEDGVSPVQDLPQGSIRMPSRTSVRDRHYRQRPRSNDDDGSLLSSPATRPQSSQRSSNASAVETHDTTGTSPDLLGPLQTKGLPDDSDPMDPLLEDDPKSFDLVAPLDHTQKHTGFSLETRSQQLFSREHLEVIFADRVLLHKFSSFLGKYRPQSMPVLIYYLDALKALRAIKYSNAIQESLEPIEDHDFTTHPPRMTVNAILEEKANQAFDVLVKNDLPAYITHLYVQVVSQHVQRRVSGTLPPHLREASEGLAEVFCLTDPSRPDNPIIFASEEFHRTTQYGVDYAVGRNCRFLQGPNTNPFSVKRIGDALRAGKDHCEVFLNYRRDGSPFMNLLMTAPLCDSRGKIRYYIGAQADVSGLVKDCTDLESLGRLVAGQDMDKTSLINGSVAGGDDTNEFQELSEMLNVAELETVRKYGGRMHRDHFDDEDNSNKHWHRPRLLLREQGAEQNRTLQAEGRMKTKLTSVYQNVTTSGSQILCLQRLTCIQYLLVRPYPSLRILFASPSLRVPGILQSPFMNKIGGSSRVREELTAALAEGRGVTAKVRWTSKSDEGRSRWIHCTPLFGHNGKIGVWMIVIVDDENEVNRKWRLAPPVDAKIGRTAKPEKISDDESLFGVYARDATRKLASIRTYNRPMTPRSPPQSARVHSPHSFWTDH